MISPGLVYLVLSAALFAVAVVTHFHATALFIPLSSLLTILTAILPILGLVNAYIRPNLLLSAHHSSSPLHTHLPTALQTLQAVLSTILGTLLLQASLPGSTFTSCALEAQWMKMFRARDAKAVRAVQDALECCGFNSVRDRAYPFGQPSTCAETYGREDSCGKAWSGVMRTSAGVDFGVVLAVALLQVIGLLMMKEGASWWTAWRVWGGRREGSSSGDRQSRRPLLTGVEESEEDEEEEIDTGRDERRVYGSGGDGPRVEPSPMVHERTAWEDY